MSSDFNNLPNPFAQLTSEQLGDYAPPESSNSSRSRRAPSKRSKKEHANSSQSGIQPEWESNWSVDRRGGQARRSVWRATKYLLAVIACFAILIGIRQATGHWLLQRLTADFEQLDPAQQQQRLLQIEGLGRPAIPHMVGALAAKDISTARSAYDLLRHAQNEWTALSPAEMQKRHLVMAESIEGIAARLPDDRTGWAATLLQQSIMDCVNQSSDLEASVYRNANEVMVRLSLSERSGPSILDGDYRNRPSSGRGIVRPSPKIANANTGDPTTDDPTIVMSGRLAVSAAPLPIQQGPNGPRWSDWPPQANQPSIEHNLDPEVYRNASMKLRPVEPDDPVILRPVQPHYRPQSRVNESSSGRSDDGRFETSFSNHAADTTSNVSKVIHDADLPLDAYTDRSVMFWLGSPHAKLRRKAAIELQSRGYTDRDLEMAQHMIHEDAKVRLAFLDRVSRDAAIDPRSWLWMMSEDENREVRLRVVSILATMNDHAAEDRLRTLMVQEQDPTVASRIRRVLNLR